MSKELHVTAKFSRPITEHDYEDAKDAGFEDDIVGWIVSQMDHPDNLYFIFDTKFISLVEVKEPGCRYDDYRCPACSVSLRRAAGRFFRGKWFCHQCHRKVVK